MRPLLILLAMTVTATAEPASRAERASIVEQMSVLLKDPYSLRSTGISDEQPLHGSPDIPAGICVRYNAKNALGGYVGTDVEVFIRTSSGIVRAGWRQGVTNLTCKVEGISFKPFPELMAIR